MKHIKERYMWFIGMGRLIESDYSEFMYSENDIVLFDYSKYHNIGRRSKRMIVGEKYTVAKRAIKIFDTKEIKDESK